MRKFFLAGLPGEDHRPFRVGAGEIPGVFFDAFGVGFGFAVRIRRVTATAADKKQGAGKRQAGECPEARRPPFILFHINSVSNRER